MLFIGINVPYTWPNLSTGETAVSPFTIVFQRAGSKAAGSFINAVLITSVISGGNHALYAGTRVLYGLSSHGFAPRFFSKLTPNGIPWVALLSTWLVSGLCFGSSFIGTGTLWTWLQDLVGVSNQISWLCIGLASIQFRRGVKKQGIELPFKNWTYPYGTYFQVIALTLILLVQGWTSFSPWDVSSFFQNYVELFIFPVMWIGWKFIKKTKFVTPETMDLQTDVYVDTEKDILANEANQARPWWKKAIGFLS